MFGDSDLRIKRKDRTPGDLAAKGDDMLNGGHGKNYLYGNFGYDAYQVGVDKLDSDGQPIPPENIFDDCDFIIDTVAESGEEGRGEVYALVRF